MARLAAPAACTLGIVVAVVGLGKVHAVRHAYSYTGSSRFGWSVAYIALLAIAAYGVGLPDAAPHPAGVVARRR